jgi:hypothetical protein
MGLQRIVSIGQGGQFESHCSILLVMERLSNHLISRAQESPL